MKDGEEILMIVIKRDGRKVIFDPDKIRSAIAKAFIEVDGNTFNMHDDYSKSIISAIEAHDNEISVEEIQDLIEKKLMASKRKDVAKAFIIYRNDRTRIRQNKSELMNKVREKIFASNVENQNANVDEKSFGGRMGAVNSEVLKEYALNECMSQMAKENHLNNEIYIHDLDHYAVGDHNCLSIPFDDLLAKGFSTRQTDVRPAQSVNTAFQLVAVLFQLQSLQQFGGVSATHLDWTMVPYVRKSFYKHYIDGLDFIFDESIKNAREPFHCFLRAGIKSEDVSIEDNIYKTANMQTPYESVRGVYDYAMRMTIKEISQAVEGMYHNLKYIWVA